MELLQFTFRFLQQRIKMNQPTIDATEQPIDKTEKFQTTQLNHALYHSVKANGKEEQKFTKEE